MTDQSWIKNAKTRQTLLILCFLIAARWNSPCIASALKASAWSWSGATWRWSVDDWKLFVPLVNALFFWCFTQIEHDLPFSSSYCSQGYTFFHAGWNFLTVLVELEAFGFWSCGGWLNVELTSSASPSSTATLFCLKNTLSVFKDKINKRSVIDR